jgi:hypothetical protein
MQVAKRADVPAISLVASQLIPSTSHWAKGAFALHHVKQNPFGIGSLVSVSVDDHTLWGAHPEASILLDLASA